jgi:hypothetical protein
MNIALKEWSIVIRALDRGAQIFLLRKGGIVEARRGFEPRYREFLLFPTTEHQHARFLRPEWAEQLTGTAADSDKSLSISHMARVTDVLHAPLSPDALRDAPHVWNEDFIRQRYNYRPDLPLYVLVTRVYRLDPPYVIPLRASYAGCKSWVHLTEEIPVEAARPVLDDTEFARQRRDVLRQLSFGSDCGKGREQAAE